jgi:putative transcriptional regulator
MTGKTAPKRNLFNELRDGIDALRQQREGKITLRSYEAELKPAPAISAALIRDTREQLKVSRTVFAHCLRISPRTLENWEQGRAKPNAQAAALILMVRKFPDTLERLQHLDNEAA